MTRAALRVAMTIGCVLSATIAWATPSGAAAGGVSITGAVTSPARGDGTITFTGSLVVPTGVTLTSLEGIGGDSQYNSRVKIRDAVTHKPLQSCRIPEVDFRDDLEVGYYDVKPGTYAISCEFTVPVDFDEPTAYDWTFDLAMHDWNSDSWTKETVILGQSQVLQPTALRFRTTSDKTKLRRPGLVTLGLEQTVTWSDGQSVNSPVITCAEEDGYGECTAFGRAPGSNRAQNLASSASMPIRVLVRKSMQVAVTVRGVAGSPVSIRVG